MTATNFQTFPLQSLDGWVCGGQLPSFYTNRLLVDLTMGRAIHYYILIVKHVNNYLGLLYITPYLADARYNNNVLT